MNYAEALEYLYQSLPMFSRLGAKAIKKDLKNTLALCDFLGNPQNKIKTIHVAGTNGKGSVCHILSGIFQQHGYRTGLYTSPHIQDFRERIKINGEWISKQFVADFVDKMVSISEEIKPSFFELTFVMALEYFAQSNIDIAIIETGLGGRLDSTNIITPELSVITNIGMDHIDVLGDTKPKIAFEKAGIIKPNIPVVIGKSDEEINDVFIKKAEDQSPIYFADEYYEFVEKKFQKSVTEWNFRNKKTNQILKLQPDLTGDYQEKNLITVLQCVDVLKEKFNLEEEKVATAITKIKSLTGIYGRWEILNEKPFVIMDVAHNEDGIREVLCQAEKIPHNQMHIVFGMVKDKDVDRNLRLLPTNANYYFTQAQIPRALDANELKKEAESFQLTSRSFLEVNEAIECALTSMQKDDLLLIFGSFFIVAEVNVATIQSRLKNI